MGFDVKNLRTKTATGAIYDGGLTFEYRLFTSTTEELETVVGYQEDEELRKLVAYGVEHTVKQLVAWNLEDEGEPIPLDVEVVRAKVPSQVLSDIQTFIQEEHNRGEVKGPRKLKR